MCLINLSSDFEMDQKENSVTQKYFDMTGINCHAFYPYRSNPNEYKHHVNPSCPIVLLFFNPIVQNTIRILHAYNKAYTFLGQCMNTFIAVEIFTEEKERIIFLAGPIKTRKLLDNQRCEAMQKCYDLNNAAVPFRRAHQLSHLSQILFHLIKYNYPNQCEISRIEPSSNKNNFYDESHETELLNHDLFSANVLKNKKKLTATIDYANEKIDLIFELVKLNRFSLAKRISEDLIKPVMLENDFLLARTYYLGVASFFGIRIIESFSFLYNSEMFSKYNEFINSIMHAMDKDELYYYTSLYFSDFIIQMENARLNTEDDSPASQTISYIQSNYDDDLNINTISDALNFDPSYLCRSFKKSTGITIKNYIISYRISIASELLVTSNKTIEKISKEIGFHDANIFLKHFKLHFGTTPSKYRKILKG